MDLNSCKLLSEAEDTYHIAFPSGRKFTLEKKGMSEKAHNIIKKLRGPQKFESGGTPSVPDYLNPVPQASPTDLWSQGDIRNTNSEPVPFKVDAMARQPISDQDLSAPSDMLKVNLSDKDVNPNQEITPQGAQPSGSPVANKMTSMDQALTKEQNVNTDLGEIAKKEASAEHKAIEDTQNAIDLLPSQNDIIQSYQKKDMDFEKQLSDQTIDPDRYIHHMGTGSKIAAGIAMLLGGFGAGAARQENLAAKSLENSINRDIEAQKNDQSKTMNLWKMNREAMGSDLAANLATQNQMLSVLKVKLMDAAASFKGQTAAKNTEFANTLIDQKKAENNLKLSLLNPTRENADPATAVQFLVPPEKQKEVFSEIKRATDTTAVAPKILEAFDNAAKNKHFVDLVPGMKNADQKAFIGLINTTIQDLEGSVREAVFNSIESNMLPQAFDSKEMTDKKRRLVTDYLSSKQAAPTAKGFGIDLSKYPSTSGVPQETKTMNGYKYVKGPGGWNLSK